MTFYEVYLFGGVGQTQVAMWTPLLDCILWVTGDRLLSGGEEKSRPPRAAGPLGVEGVRRLFGILRTAEVVSLAVTELALEPYWAGSRGTGLRFPVQKVRSHAGGTVGRASAFRLLLFLLLLFLLLLLVLLPAADVLLDLLTVLTGEPGGTVVGYLTTISHPSAGAPLVEWRLIFDWAYSAFAFRCFCRGGDFLDGLLLFYTLVSLDDFSLGTVASSGHTARVGYALERALTSLSNIHSVHTDTLDSDLIWRAVLLRADTIRYYLFWWASEGND